MLDRDLFHEQGCRSLGEELNIWSFLLYPILALPLLMFIFKHPEEKEFLAFPSRQPFCCWEMRLLYFLCVSSVECCTRIEAVML
jgi:hypothetical protein